MDDAQRVIFHTTERVGSSWWQADASAAEGRRPAARGGGVDTNRTRPCGPRGVGAPLPAPRPAPAPAPVASFRKKWRTSYILNHFNLRISFHIVEHWNTELRVLR
ncbi:hypothetical protein O3G_MSEX011832 [Manduca sexta]|uniref:Uncharacterized protein n=1 Tax=Manduca sexta TaxID=7130 RepID=A0A921ZM44_MANSE|nr:hypothetical protein O3G_MSEX011832 [Manduca sexta]